MERPLIKAAGVAAGTLFIAIGLSAQLGGANVFARPPKGHTVVSQAPAAASPSPQASPSAQPSPEVESMTAPGTISNGWQGGGKKKHGKGH
jgi:hypothetical protein